MGRTLVSETSETREKIVKEEKKCETKKKKCCECHKSKKVVLECSICHQILCLEHYIPRNHKCLIKPNLEDLRKLRSDYYN